jgi:hypothetical protein
MKSAGMTPHNWRQKHGLDSVEQNGEGKPTKLSSNDNKKFGGSFSFCDMSLNKIETLYNNNTKIIHTGFIEGELMFSISIPMQNELIKKKLIESFEEKHKKNQRKVLTVTRACYENNMNVQWNYSHPELWKFKDKFTGPFYQLIDTLEHKRPNS